MALVTILTTEGYKQFEDEFPYDLSYVPYGKVILKNDTGYKIGKAVIPCKRNVSLNRNGRNLKPFWKYLDRIMNRLNAHPFVTDRASQFSAHEIVSVISIHDYGKDTFHGAEPFYMEPMYQNIWKERLYAAWLELKHG